MVDSTITLYKDVGLSPDYSRTMDFTTKAEQKAWFASLATPSNSFTITANYNKIQNSFVIHEEVGDMYGYSYVRIQGLDTTGREYYGFITKVELVDGESTRFDVLLDVIQTFMCEWELGQCYVYKEHCDRWGSGNNPIRITPGTDGITANMVTKTCQQLSDIDYVFGVIIFTSTRSYYVQVTENEFGEIRDTSINYAIIPLYKDVDKADKLLYFRFTYGVDTPSSEINFRLPSFNEFMSGIAPSVLGIDPNSVVGSFILPDIGCNVSVIPYEDTYAITMFDSPANIVQDYLIKSGGEEYYPKYPLCAWDSKPDVLPTDGDIGCQLMTPSQIFSLMNLYGLNKQLDNVSKPVKPSDNTESSSEHEPALYMHPYTIRSVISNGTIVGNIPDISVFSDAPNYLEIFTNIKASGVQSYIYYGDPDTPVDKNTDIANGNCFLINNITADVIGDNYLSYCLTARDSDRRMMWSSIASNTINQAVFMGYGGALVGSRSNSGKNDPMKNADAIDVANYGGAMVKAMGYGLASSFITSAISGVDMWIQQEAKEQTIRNTPPDTISLGSGAGLINSGEFGYYYVERVCDDVNYNTAYNRFKYYGYTVNTMEKPNIRSRKYYNYICTGNTVIKGAIPANIKQALVKIFENGITLFHADYCDTTEYPTNSTGEEYENIERSLM